MRRVLMIAGPLAVGVATNLLIGRLVYASAPGQPPMLLRLLTVPDIVGWRLGLWVCTVLRIRPAETHADVWIGEVITSLIWAAGVGAVVTYIFCKRHRRLWAWLLMAAFLGVWAFGAWLLSQPYDAG
jgi:hypothetical protein